MIIISTIDDDISVRIPNNLAKNDVETRELHLRNTETKKEFMLELEDESSNEYFYQFTINFGDTGRTRDELVGEWEYEIEGNTGLMRIEIAGGRRVYDEEITYKAYDA
jgi:hypothetical protein